MSGLLTAPAPPDRPRGAGWLAHRLRPDAGIALGLALAVLSLYLRTLAPSVLRIFDDCLEFQVVCPTLGIAHPTGYPLYTLLGWLCVQIIPIGDAAYRVNVFSALCGAITVGLVYLAVVAGLPMCHPFTTQKLPLTPALSPQGGGGQCPLPGRERVRVRVGRFWTARIAGLVAGGTLAASSTFWEYSTVAEVYTLNAAFLAAMAFLLLRWAGARSRTTLLLAALCFGLSLAHHRTMLLLAPVFLLFVAALDWRALFQDPLRRLAATLLPLLLYLYIPWRGLYTTSLDGQYQNTPAGFFQWTLGLYSAWWQRVDSWAELGANLAAYRDLVLADFTIVGVLLALAGFLWLLWRQRPLALFLGLSYAGLTAFSVVYRGIGGFPDFFFIAPHVFLVMLVGVGIYALSSVFSPQSSVLSPQSSVFSPQSSVPSPQSARYAGRRQLATCLLPIACCLLLLSLPLFLLFTNFPARDVSRDTAARDAGRDVMSQPLEEGAAIVGLLGETTLVRYFQWTQGLRPDLVPIAADSEEARLAAVAEQLATGRAVYLTRPLPGAAGRWHLSSVGPLIRVRPGPVTDPPAVQHPCDVQYAHGVRLLGYDIVALNDGTEGPLPVESGQRVRVTLYWQATRVITDELLVFVHVLAPRADGHRLGQDDAPPVRGCYPATAWRPGEIVADAHDVRVLPGAPPGAYRLRVGWETPDGRALDVTAGSDVVGEFAVRRPAEPPSVEGTIAHPTHVEFGNVLVLRGHDLEPVTARPGDPVAFALLWQARDAPGADYGLVVRLVAADGRAQAGADAPLSPGYPSSRWAAGEVVRAYAAFVVPPDAAPGVYRLELGLRGPDGRLLPRTWWFLPLGGDVAELQRITVEP